MFRIGAKKGWGRGAVKLRAGVFGGRLKARVGPYLLPPAVRRFYLAAEREAKRLGDERTLEERSTALSLRQLLRWARGRQTVAEIGTSAGWAAIALALADQDRQVITLDPFPHPQRHRYLALVPEQVRDRVQLVSARGEDGPPASLRPDFLFIDEAHEHQGVVACFQAWRPALQPGALVVFHDYHSTWPGVISAVQELGLDGEVRQTSFLWRAPV